MPDKPENAIVLRPEEAHLLRNGQPVGGKEVKRGRGRPTKCTVEFLQQLGTLIAGGIHPYDACASLEVSRDSRHDWTRHGIEALKKDPNSKSIYAQFVRVMEGKGAFARAMLGAKLHEMGRQGNIDAIKTWMRYYGAPGFQGTDDSRSNDGVSEGVVTIEFDGAAVFQQRRFEPETVEEEEPEELIDE